MVFNNIGQVDFASAPVDLGDLATTIAQASEALTAAALALAEAAKPISNASPVLDDYHLSNVSLNTAPYSDMPEKPESINKAEVSEHSLSQVADHLKDKSQSEPNNLAVSSPTLSVISIWSESSCGEEAGPFVNYPMVNEPLAAYQLSPHNTDDDLVEPHATPGPELNSKRWDSSLELRWNSMPPVRSTKVSRPVSSRLQPNTTRLLEIMKSHPTIPPGQNYVYLDRSSEVLAFIAYMALQANRIICVLPDHHLGTYPELLKSLTQAKMHTIDTPEQLRHVLAKFTTTNAS
ncbi:hypothetical protein ACGC1H_002430 [Rhizoctonia solani]